MFVSGILLRRPFSTRLTSQVVNNPPLQYEDTQFLFTYKFELKFTFIHIHMPEGLGFFVLFLSLFLKSIQHGPLLLKRHWTKWTIGDRTCQYRSFK